MKVEVCWADGRAFNETHTCTHAIVADGVLRLERRPNRQQAAIGMSDVEHIVSIPLVHLLWWKERES